MSQKKNQLQFKRRKRINSSEPPKRLQDQNVSELLSNSSQMNNSGENMRPKQNFQEYNHDYYEAESVISEYVVLDSKILSPSKTLMEESSSELMDSDDYDRPPHASNHPQQLLRRKILEQRQQQHLIENRDEINSNKTTSEINALQNNIKQKMRKPIYFNVIVVGESGLGKSTFIDIFLSKRFRKQQAIRPSTQNITENKGQRVESNTDFNINMIDTPGYNTETNMKQWYQKIRNYILDQFEKQKQYEDQFFEQGNQNYEDFNYQDTKVHSCLYFLSGPRIKKMDMAIMKKLQKYVNIIPILAKGDSFTTDEIIEIKTNLNSDAQKYDIEWFDIKKALRHNPEYLKRITDGPHGQAPPFLLISSVQRIEITQNQWVYGRNYRWGTCNVENPEHSDFNLLYNILIGHLSLKLIDRTKRFQHQYFKQKKYEEQSYMKKENDTIKNLLKATTGVTVLGLLLFGFNVNKNQILPKIQ